MANEVPVPSNATTNVFFGLEVEGVLHAAFSDLAIVSEVKPLAVTDGAGETDMPDQRIRPLVTLKRRHNDDLSLFAWHQSAIDGPIQAAGKPCTITVFDASGVARARYLLDGARPFRIEIGPLNASPSGDLLETVTLICDALRRMAL